MIGYKGIELRNGILRSKYKDILEVNVPKKCQEIDDGQAFSECGYSFCGTMEEVVYHENFIIPNDNRVYRDVRLFEIDTLDGEVIGSSKHYKTTKISVIREVPKDEILEYFFSNESSKEIMLNNLHATEKHYWDIYSKEEFEPYRLIKDEKEIEELYIRSCIRREQSNVCQQFFAETLELKKCEGCFGAEISLGLKESEVDYLYLMTRSKVFRGFALKDINEYRELKNRSCNNEIESIERIVEYMYY